MAAKISIGIVLLALTGCGLGGGNPSLSVVCPTVLPKAPHVEWPQKRPESLAELQIAYLEGKFAYDTLAAQRRETEEAWAYCRKLVED